MQFKHLQTINQPPVGEAMVKVTAICWSPSAKRLAVCTTDRVVLMFDEDGVKKDKFSTKPADKGPKNYVVTQMSFSPGSDKLAIAQSDCMVFVYKLGAEWGEKKSICNKFQHSNPITTLVWPTKRPNEVIYGLADGKVKIGEMKTHKPTTLYQTESYVTAMAPAPSGLAVAIAHLDGSIYTYSFDSPERGARVIVRHPSIPFALCWGASLAVAGNDSQVSFYDEDGGQEDSFDYADNADVREFTVAVANPTGDAVVMGNFDGFFVYNRNKDTGVWEDVGFSKISNLYSVSALAWKPDGDKLIAGNVCGIVDIFDVCVKRSLYKGGFEMTYVSHSQVIVRHVDSNSRIVVKSQFGFEITKTNIYKSRYVVATTSNTLLLGDMETLKLSEIQWHGNGNEKFIFDNPAACIIYFAGEISLVEYGLNELLGSIRTSNISSHVLSLRINERPLAVEEGHHHEDNKKIAFLLDAQTICVKDLVSLSSAIVNHDSKIDWLELNGRANLVLFRDKRRFLYLYDIISQKRNQLLSYCTYVQWVPASDVVVAQSRSNLCVWYNINAPDRVTLHAIKGDIEEIERAGGKTEVVVDEGMTQAVYPLDEPLIEFCTAVEDRDFPRAMDILESLEASPEAEAMWQQLCGLAIAGRELIVAQRCAAATGNAALCRYLTVMNEERLRIEEDLEVDSTEHYSIRSKLALLDKDLRLAEDELLAAGKVEDCIHMYQNLFKFDAAIRVAEQNRHSDALTMRQEYFQYLLDSNQEEKAAALKEKEGEYMQAITLYLKGGMPAKAADVILTNDMSPSVQVLESVANALVRAGLHDIAGDFFDRLQESQKALDSYIRGHAYKKAVELARRSYPSKVVDLQEQWGDYLVAQKQIDMAINHYIEAKHNQKAIEAAMGARQHSRALQLLDALDSDSSRPYYKQLARYYEDSSQYELAERCFIAAGQADAAVEMHTRLGHWEVAHKIATNYLSEGEVGLLYINQAQKFESSGRFREAEKLYLQVKEKDLAINMYKKHRRFDDMVRLVQQHRPDLLKETHQFLGQSFEIEGNLKDAEHHYVEGNEWQSAVNMYRSNDLWDDAIRVAKFYGGVAACRRVSISLLVALGVPEGSKLLQKHGLVETAIDNAAESGAYDIAFDLAGVAMPKKLPDIHLKYALFLENEEEKFKEAEEEFVKAGKPKEAIEMWMHQLDWAAAVRVAETYDPVSVPDVYIAQARAKAEASDFKTAEDLYITAAHPEMALAMYQEADMWPEALKVAQMHLPHRVSEITATFKSSQTKAGKGGGSKSDYLTTGKGFEQKKQWQQAIDTYLSAREGRLESTGDLEQIWNRALDVARNHVPNKLVEVALEVSRRLVAIGRDEAAADAMFDVGRADEAIDMCLAAKAFDKARALAKGNPSLARRVDDAYQSHLVVNENAKELQVIGKGDVALDVLAKKGSWDELYKVAAQQGKGGPAIAKYVIMQVEELLSGKSARKVDEAVRSLSKREGPASDAALSVYHRLVCSVLGRSYQEDKDTDYPSIVSLLRDTLFKLAGQYKNKGDKKAAAEVSELLLATHYTHMMLTVKSLGLKDLVAKCAITLLKYPEYIPQDKAFYVAGISAREMGQTNLAFLLLNRFVDLTEAIDNSDPSYVDNSQFEEADAVPLSGPLPSSHYIHDEDLREEVRTWVLSVVTDSNVEQRLKPRNSSKNTLYEGLYSSDRPTCIVTGFPVHPVDVLEVSNSVANRKDWNFVVAKTKVDPWTGQPQSPMY